MPRLRLRRGELLLRQGDWWRGLADYEARLEIPGERYTPALPRWQGEPLDGRLLLYPEQADIESDAALRDTLMLARGVDAVVQCARARSPIGCDGPDRAPRANRSTTSWPPRRCAACRIFSLNWTRDSLPPPRRSCDAEAERSARSRLVQRRRAACAGLDVDARPRRQVAACRLVVGDDTLARPYAAAALGHSARLILLPHTADWLWGPSLGLSPWYATVELLRDDDREGLAARLS